MINIAPATGNMPATPAAMGASASSDPAAPALPIATLAPVGQKPVGALPNQPSAPSKTSFAATLQQRLKLISADNIAGKKQGHEAIKAAAADPRSLATATQGLLENLAASSKDKTPVSASSIADEKKSAPLTDTITAATVPTLPAATGTPTQAPDVQSGSVPAGSDPSQSAPLALNVPLPVSAQATMPAAQTQTGSSLRHEPPTITASSERQAWAGTGPTVAHGDDVPTKALPGSAAQSNLTPVGVATEQKTATPGAALAPASAPAILAADTEKSTASANAIGKDATSFQDVLNNRLVQTQPTSPHATVPTANIPERPVATPVAAADWANDVGNQLSWMATKGESRADLVLNPPQMGRIEVSISISGDQASASFVSTNPEVRNLLQDSMHRLREVLADSGVFLGQANIGAESFNQGQNPQEKGGKSPDDSFSSGSQSLLGSASRPLSISPAATRQGRGLIDLFA